MQTTVAFKPAMAVRAAAPSRAARQTAVRPAAVRAAPVAARTAFLSGSVAGSAASVRFVGKAAGKGGFRLVTAMAKKSVGDLTEADLKGKVVFERADLNVPLDKELNITDDTRIRVRAQRLSQALAADVALLWCQAAWLAFGLRRTPLRFIARCVAMRRGVRLPRWRLPRLLSFRRVAQVWVILGFRFAADALRAWRTIASQAAIPTLQYLTSKGAKVMLTSHLVRAAARSS